MNYSLSLTQQVNFYVSVAFIFVFGVFMSTTVIAAINRDTTSLKYFSVASELSQLDQ